MNTVESNKLIADFMGINAFIRYDEFPELLWTDNNTGDYDNLGIIKYDFSWDWLMPVVEKINNTKDEFGNDYSFQIGNGYVWVDPHIGNRIFFSGNEINHRNEPMINKVYRGVIKFIEYYNTLGK